MPIVTLTTDLGNTDFYAGRMKGALYKEIPGITIVDITHEIEPFNILQAAFVIRNSYPSFPHGTLHLIAVNLFHDKESHTLLIEKGGHRFIGADNGLFGLIWEDHFPEEIYRVPLPESIKSRSIESAYVQLASRVFSGEEWSVLGKKMIGYRVNRMGKPVLNSQFLKGSVVYFDRFGNAIINIRADEFEKAAAGRRYTIVFKRYSDLHEIHSSYSDVEEGDLVCFFNSTGYLEIALNKGNARNLLNLNTGDIVQVEFES